MFKKVLLSLPTSSSYFPGLTRSFDYLNIKVNYFDYRKVLFHEKISFIFIGGCEKTIWFINRRLLKVIKDYRPNIFFVMKGERILPETIEIIKSLGIITVNWFPDYVNAFDLALKLSSHYDYFFHFDPLSVSRLKKAGRTNVYHLPFASDILPDDKKPPINEDKYQISFIGNHDNYREKYLNDVRNLGLNIWGNKKWKASSLAKYYRGELHNSKFAEVSRASKININIQHEFPCEGLVLRVFEVLGAGAFLLTEKNKDGKRLFKNKIATFTSPEDLRKKAIYFLAHDKEREKLSNGEYLEVKANHTYLHRISKILKTVS